MPELPEVETAVRDLRQLLTGQTVTGAVFATGAQRSATTATPMGIKASTASI